MYCTIQTRQSPLFIVCDWHMLDQVILILGQNNMAPFGPACPLRWKCHCKSIQMHSKWLSSFHVAKSDLFHYDNDTINRAQGGQHMVWWEQKWARQSSDLNTTEQLWEILDGPNEGMSFVKMLFNPSIRVQGTRRICVKKHLKCFGSLLWQFMNVVPLF